MGGAVDQSKLLAKGSDALRLPAAYVICNQSPPVDGQPSLMTFRQVGDSGEVGMQSPYCSMATLIRLSRMKQPIHQL